MIKDKNIILGVCGGIAAYKSVELLRLMKKAGADVKVVMTSSALEFVGELTFKVLSENHVCTGLFNSGDSSVRHIEWASRADAALIAPATANMIGKMARGIADDALSTMMMAVKAPVMICPSMNTYMYENRALQRNLDILEQDGVIILEPGSGELACKTSGAGRLPEPELIFDRLVKLFHPCDMKGKKVIVTAGPTREAMDPVRYISNHSSGKMGYAVAEAAEKRGAMVTLITGPVSIAPPFGVELIKVTTAHEMANAVLSSMDDADIIIKVAAVADYRPLAPRENKIKKDQMDSRNNSLTLDLVENPDILKMVGERKRNQFLAGFAAETENLIANALAKIKKKNLDMIAANIVGREDSGFEADTNKITLLSKDGSSKELPLLSKQQAAHELLDHILGKIKHQVLAR
ncbi:MAG: bifunctional phosphopantothenoylcysteine decarboxylase/phosphopantothenate--cysteine ligase CoaBC [Desulfamplus sp.]|nr:bifunctional phosphopantothenoylcysteine decarboxylase/phosphopantothenate--cysteine ligase CoaBC [Desulfamplus sp.]